jgi:hypothetical protein
MLTTNNLIFQLNTCSYSPYVTSSLTRGWVCSLQLLLVLGSALTLRSESCGTHDKILLSQIRDSTNLGARSTYLNTPPHELGSLFVASYDLRATVEAFDPASTRHEDNRARYIRKFPEKVEKEILA